ncbi:hypothetical protein MNB_SV-9-1207 [hydrothermal vent metagenome]|uniref:Lipoprotein n=1 Tax=hydrothermal vent metagenome TaxID=652676 RepID=A0A1W1BB55_9ZZZZ
MKQKIILMSILGISSLTLVGCGGSSSSNTTGNIPVAPMGGTAFYVDSEVEGVDVICGSIKSVTDVNGMFRYEDGKDCQFSIGGVPLRTDSGLYQDKVIIEDNIQTAQYLQSMDYDGNPNNGISIHNQTANVMTQNGVTHVPRNDQELAENVVMMENSNSGYHGHFVNKQDAENHVHNTQNQHNNNTQHQNDGYPHNDNTQHQNDGYPHNDNTQHQNDGYPNNDNTQHQNDGYPHNDNTQHQNDGYPHNDNTQHKNDGYR